MSLNSGPSFAPSNAVEATEMIRSTTVHGTGVSRAAAVPGTRSSTGPSCSRPIGDSEPNSPNSTPNASPLRTQGSTPYRLIPMSIATK